MGSATPVPRGGGPAGPRRTVPALPAGIPMLPGQATAPRRARRGWIVLIVLLVLVGLASLPWFKDHRSDYDRKRIEAAVRQAMFAHPTKGTRIPVKLWNGDRILRITFATVEYPPKIGLEQGPPTTCVSFDVLDANTGAKDMKYFQGGSVSCIEGMAYRIH
jgi:hypothetical protein